MSTECNVNKTYNLTLAYGLPSSCNATQIEEIFLKALESSDPDQRYAALVRVGEIPLTPKIKEKLLEIFSSEKDKEILRALIDLCSTLKIKEAVPLITEYLNDSCLQNAAILALEEMGDSSVIPALQNAFQNNPSKKIAELLLKLGDPYPYYHNFFSDELKIFDESDTRIEYSVPLFWMELGGNVSLGFGFVPFNPIANSGEEMGPKSVPIGKSTFPSEKVPTSASELKPIVRKNITLLLDAFLKRQDSTNGIPFLFTLLKYPQHGISFAEIDAAFQKMVRPEDYPFLIAELEKKSNPVITEFILYYLEVQAHKGKLNLGDQEEKAILVLHRLLKDKTFETKAVDLLAHLDDKSIIPYLLKKIEEDPYCSIAIHALSQLESNPGEFEGEFKKILKNNYYSEEAKFQAALALAQAGKRDGLQLLFEKLYEGIMGLHPTTPQVLMNLHNIILSLIQPEALSQIKKFIESQNFFAITAGLDFLAQIKNPESIPMILPLLDPEKIQLSTLSIDPLVKEFFLNFNLWQKWWQDWLYLKSLDPKFDPEEAKNNPEKYYFEFYKSTSKMMSKNQIMSEELKKLIEHSKILKLNEVSFKLNIKFKALLALANIRKPNEVETLEIVKKEVDFWKSFMTKEDTPKNNELYSLVQKFLPELEDYVEDCELEIRAEQRKENPRKWLQNF